MKIGTIVGIVLLLAGAGGAYYWFFGQPKPVENPYKTAAVERRDLSARVTASGTLQARVTVQVGSQVSGRLKALYADFNSQVKKGDVIARIDPQLFEAAVARSRANYKAALAAVSKAEATLMDAQRTQQRVIGQRTEGLASQADVDSASTATAVAKANLDSANASVDQARAQLNQDEVNLSLTVIKSPIDGIVISRAVDVGQTVAAAMQAPVLFTIAEDLTKMRLEASIPESDVGKLKPEMAAQFTVDAFSNKRFRGTITQVRNAPTTVQNVVTYTAIVSVENPELQLRPGMTATVTIVTATRQGVLALPNAALRFRPSTMGPPEGGSGARGPEANRNANSPGSVAASAASAPKNTAHAMGANSAAPRAAESDAPASSSTASTAPSEREAAPPTDSPFDGPPRKLVWRLEQGQPVAARIALGVTDGTYTEILDPSVQEGDAFIVEGPGPSAGGGAAPGAKGANPNQNFRMRGVF